MAVVVRVHGNRQKLLQKMAGVSRSTLSLRSLSLTGTDASFRFVMIISGNCAVLRNHPDFPKCDKGLVKLF